MITRRLFTEKRHILMAAAVGIIAIFAIRFLTPGFFAIVWQVLAPAVLGFYLAGIALGTGVADSKTQAWEDGTLAVILMALVVAVLDFFGFGFVMRTDTVTGALVTSAIEFVVFCALGLVGGLLGALTFPRLPTLIVSGIGAFVSLGLMFFLPALLPDPETPPASRQEIESMVAPVFLIHLLPAFVTGLLSSWSAIRRGLVSDRWGGIKQGALAGIVTGILASSAMGVTLVYMFMCPGGAGGCDIQMLARGGVWLVITFAVWSVLNLVTGMIGGVIAAFAARRPGRTARQPEQL